MSIRAQELAQPYLAGITLTTTQRQSLHYEDSLFRNRVRARLDSAYARQSAPRQRPDLSDLQTQYEVAIRAVLTPEQYLIFERNRTRVLAQRDSVRQQVRQRAAAVPDSVRKKYESPQ